jgi:hypothetical protein
MDRLHLPDLLPSHEACGCPGQMPAKPSSMVRGRGPHEVDQTLRRSTFVTLLEMVECSLFRDHELDAEIVARLQLLADGLLRLLISQ